MKCIYVSSDSDNIISIKWSNLLVFVIEKQCEA
jgi:hypothetical protein